MFGPVWVPNSPWLIVEHATTGSSVPIGLGACVPCMRSTGYLRVLTSFGEHVRVCGVP